MLHVCQVRTVWDPRKGVWEIAQLVPVIPAKAGIHCADAAMSLTEQWISAFRRNDEGRNGVIERQLANYSAMSGNEWLSHFRTERSPSMEPL